MSALGVSSNVSNKPINVKMKNKNYVMYRNTNGKVVLLDSVCPHRGADLCSGVIVHDCIQCPYHGWLFDDSGTLKHVPTTNKKIKAKVKSYTDNIVEDSGFVWFVENAYDYTLPTKHVPELNNETQWNKIYGSQLVQGNINYWIENSTDISHINYVHNFGDENNGTIQDISISVNEEFIDCQATVQPKATSVFTSTMQPEQNKGSSVLSKFIYPSSSCISILLKEPYKFITFTSLLHVDDNTTQMSWCFLYPNSWLFNLPFVRSRFESEMYKTVLQDENIIKNLTDIIRPYKLNGPVDIFQNKVMKIFYNK